jgi:hypothetical protein
MYEPSIQRTIKDLTNNKSKIFYEIDATKLNSPETLSLIDPEFKKFDRIIWNFPHAGFPE